MPSSSQNKTPMTSHSHRRLPWKGRQLKICLKSEYSSVDADGHPPMLVDVTLNFLVKFRVPSPVEGRFYDFGCSVPPTTRYSLPVDNLSLHLSMLDAFRESIAPSVTSPLHGEILRLLGPDITCLADDRTAEFQGHTAMKVGANVTCFLELDWDMVRRIINHQRAGRRRMDGGEEGSLGTCSICLDELRKEWVWPVTLSCSHLFHLGCIAPWLQRQNSCPVCRSRQPIASVPHGSLA